LKQILKLCSNIIKSCFWKAKRYFVFVLRTTYFFALQCPSVRFAVEHWSDYTDLIHLSHRFRE